MIQKQPNRDDTTHQSASKQTSARPRVPSVEEPAPPPSTSTHLAAEHEGDGAVGARHFAVAEHGREALHLLPPRGHLVHSGAVGRQPAPPRALAAPPAPPGSPCTSSFSSSTSTLSSSSTAAAAAPCSHHPPSFLASLHRGGEETTPRALPSFRENPPHTLTPPPPPPPPSSSYQVEYSANS